MPLPEGNMASFIMEGLTDEFTSPTVKLSAVELWPGLGHSGNEPRQSGCGETRPTHSLPLDFNSRRIFAPLLPTSPHPAGPSSFTSPPMDKGSRMGVLLLLDCTGHTE